MEDREQLIANIEAYQEGQTNPPFVVVQYAQDVSPESYLQRAPTGRPKGLAPDREYVIINYLNTPGSIEETIISNDEEEARKIMGGEGASEEEALFLEEDVEFVPGDRKFVLKIYSPNLSEKFREAEKSKDIYEQRRLSYWALNHIFPDDYVGKNILNEHDKPMGNYASGLFYNPSGSDGLTVYTFTELSVEKKIVTIIKQEPIHYDANLGWADYYDANFPVDVNLYVSETQPANGDKYYGNEDFIGKYGESALVVGAGQGSGFMVGRLRGWGYCEYYYSIEGVAVDVTAFSYGTITGKYLLRRTEQTPYDLAGNGTVISFGAYFISGTSWQSISNEGEVLFEGTSEGLSVGIDHSALPNGAFSGLKTNTTLVFPTIIKKQE